MNGIEILDPVFRSYVLANAPLEKLADGFRWTEGPVWFGDLRLLLFSDIPNDRVMRWTEHGTLDVFREPCDYENGHYRDLEGRLVSCSHRGRCVKRTEHDGRTSVLADRFEGRRLNSPNDVVVKSDGSLWFTDPLYGIQTDYEGGRAESETKPAVYRLDAASGALTRVADDFEGPNGLCFSPDEKRLYVAETGRMFDAAPEQHIRVFDVSGDGRRLSNGRVFHKVQPGAADGLRVDEDGNVWSSAADGVHCIAPSGALLGRIRVPSPVSNLTFGGAMKDRLFICASQALYSIFLNRRGAQRP
ncbi:MAG TPA: SMP-30/gluconolactonase/LRE family protein [Usitatibacter sp.]|nr:SMP-30/gluconolactonase/LRE family protein [Usitatibacter sp.]